MGGPSFWVSKLLTSLRLLGAAPKWAKLPGFVSRKDRINSRKIEESECPTHTGREQFLVWLVVMAYDLSHHHGAYSPSVLLRWTVLSVLALWGFAWRSQIRWDRPRVGVALALMFVGFMTMDPRLLHESVRAGWAFRLFALVPWVLGGLIGLALAFEFKKSRWLGAVLWAALIAVFAQKWLVIFASPAPFIDVHRLTTMGVDHLLDGLNPYQQSYPDIYQGTVGIPTGVGYWPAVLMVMAPFRWLLGDIRYALIAADVATLVALGRILSGRGLRRETVLAMLLAWSVFPVFPFVLEQSWIDPLVMAAIAWAWLAWERNHALGLGLALGLACAFKQYGVLFAAPWAFAFVWARWPRQLDEIFRMLAGIAAVWALTFGPFLIWDAAALVSETLGVFVRYPLRLDALSYAAIFGRWGWSPVLAPSMACVLLAGIAFLGGRTILRAGARGVSPTLLFDLSIGLFSVFFFFGKLAFCNYYYFLAFQIFCRVAAVR